MHLFVFAVDALDQARGCSGDHAPVAGTTWSGKDWLRLAVRENVQRRPARSTPAERVFWVAASRYQ
jgi:hypothetical protein